MIILIRQAKGGVLLVKEPYRLTREARDVVLQRQWDFELAIQDPVIVFAGSGASMEDFMLPLSRAVKIRFYV